MIYRFYESEMLQIRPKTTQKLLFFRIFFFLLKNIFEIKNNIDDIFRRAGNFVQNLAA